MTDLAIVCVSRFGAHAKPFVQDLAASAHEVGAKFVLGADGIPPAWAKNVAAQTVHVRSQGYVESVLDAVIAACPDGYVLRMDDDEKISRPMLHWLAAWSYRAADHWAFPRMHLWPDGQHYIANHPLWPDLQTRLSVKAKAGGRPQIHQGSPFGTGRVVEHAPIEHHKFLVRSLDEREKLLAGYECLQPGAGANFAPFSVPERYEDKIQTRPVRLAVAA